MVLILDLQVSQAWVVILVHDLQVSQDEVVMLVQEMGLEFSCEDHEGLEEKGVI